MPTGPLATSAILPIVLAALVGGEMVVRLGCRRTSVGRDPTGGGKLAPVPLLCAARLLEFQRLLLVFLDALLVASGQPCGGRSYPISPRSMAAATRGRAHRSGS